MPFMFLICLEVDTVFDTVVPHHYLFMLRTYYCSQRRTNLTITESIYCLQVFRYFYFSSFGHRHDMLLMLYAADNTIVILASLGVGAIVIIVIVITVAIVVSKKRTRFVTSFNQSIYSATEKN